MRRITLPSIRTWFAPAGRGASSRGDQPGAELERGKGLIIIDGSENKPVNPIGEAILQSIDQCRYEKQIILPGEYQTYKIEEKLKCLERIILSAKYFARDNFEGRNYIQQILDRFRHIKDRGTKNKILTVK